MSAPEVRKPFRKCCNVVTGYESFGGDEPMRLAEQLLADLAHELDKLRAELVRAERRQTVYLDLNAGLREALRDTLAALEGANRHIQEELQPEFQRLAEDGELTWPDAWHTTPYDESQAAMRLATWWHGVGTEETIDRARAVLAGEGGPAAEEDG